MSEATPTPSTESTPEPTLGPTPGGTRRVVRSAWRRRSAVSPDRAVLVVVGLAFVVRVLWVWYGHRTAEVGDPFQYVYYGLELAQGNGYDSYPALTTPWPDVPTAFYAIGYPAFLALVFAVARPFGFTVSPGDVAFSEAAWVYGVTHAILGAITVYFVARIARRLLGPRAGVIAAVIVACWPNLVIYTATAHVETLYLFLLTAAVLVMLPAFAADSTSRWTRLVTAGTLLGLSAQVRPLVALITPAIVIAARRRPDNWGVAIRRSGLVIITMLAVLAPWTIRNAMVMPGFVLITTGSGDAACMARYPDAPGDFVSQSPGCLNDAGNVPWDEAEIIKNRENTSRAIEFILQEPKQELRLWFWRGFRAFEGDHEGRIALEARDAATDEYINPLFTNRGRDVADRICDLYYWGVLALAGLGLGRFRRSVHRGGTALIFGGIFAGVIVPFMLFGDSRYKLPMHPFVAVIATVGVLRLLELRAADRAGGPDRDELTSTADSRPPIEATSAPLP